VYTDAGGNYTFVSVQPGAYQLQASATGFVAAFYNTAAPVVDCNEASSFSAVLDVVTSGIDVTLSHPGNIQGVVRTSSGTPLQGVVVYAVHGALSTYTFTSAGGTYAITGLAPGQWQVTGGFVPEMAAPSPLTVAVAESATTTADLTYNEFGSVDGDVVDDLGAPIAGVQITATGAYAASASSDGTGHFSIGQLLPGAWSITGATLPGYIQPVALQLTVSAGASTAAHLGYVRLGSVGGHVTDDAGTSLSGVAILLDGVQAASTGADGMYLITTTAGSHLVSVPDRAGYITPAPRAVAVNPPASGAADFVLTRKGAIAGTTRDDAGAPLEGVSLTLDGTSSTSTAGDGGYRFSDVIPGPHVITGAALAHHVTPAAVSLAVAPGATAVGDLTYARMATVSGVVADDAGTPFGGVSVSATGALGSVQTQTAGDGSYSLEMAPALWTVSVPPRPGYNGPAGRAFVLGAGEARSNIGFTYQRIPVLVIEPASLAFDGAAGDTLSPQQVTVRNTGTAPAVAVTLAVGPTMPWATADPPQLGTIDAGSSANGTISAAIPGDKERGTYNDRVTAVTADTATSAGANIAVRVEPQRDTLRVHVHTEAGAPIAGASVHVAARDRTVTVTNGVTSWVFDGFDGTTDASGNATFAGLPLGPYVYSISAGQYIPASDLTGVQAGGSTLDVTLTASPLDISFTVDPVTVPDQYQITLAITYGADLPTPTIAGVPLWFCFDHTNGPQTGVVRVFNPSRVRLTNIVVENAAESSVIVFDNLGEVGTLEAGATSAPLGFVATGPVVTQQSADGGIKITGDYLIESTPGVFETKQVIGAIPVSLCPPPPPQPLPPPPPPENPGIAFDGCWTYSAEGLLDLFVLNSGNVPLHNLRVRTARREEASGQGVSVAIDPGSVPSTLVAGQRADLRATLTEMAGLSIEDVIVEADYDAPTPGGSVHDFFGIQKAFVNLRPRAGCTSTAGGGNGGGGFGGGGGGLPPTPEQFRCYTAPGDCFRTMVKFELQQEITLEREAFDATLGLGNPGTDAATGVTAQLRIIDELGNDAMANFTVLNPVLTNIDSIAAGTISGGADASVRWRIGPKAGAGGTSGKRYFVSSSLSYDLGGSHFYYPPSDYRAITVKPEPHLVVDYYLPSIVQNSVPFRMAFTFENRGPGVARAVTLTSGQPHIVENVSGAAIAFTVQSCQVLGGASSPTLTVNAGDIAAGQTARGYCTMTVDADGQFLEFTATYEQIGEGAGLVPSAIDAVRTHILEPPPLAPACGEEQRYFLDRDGNGKFDGLFSFQSIEPVPIADPDATADAPDEKNYSVTIHTSSAGIVQHAFYEESGVTKGWLLTKVTADGQPLCRDQYQRIEDATYPPIYGFKKGIYIASPPASTIVLYYEKPEPLVKLEYFVPVHMRGTFECIRGRASNQGQGYALGLTLAAPDVFVRGLSSANEARASITGVGQGGCDSSTTNGVTDVTVDELAPGQSKDVYWKVTWVSSDAAPLIAEHATGGCRGSQHDQNGNATNVTMLPCKIFMQDAIDFSANIERRVVVMTPGWAFLDNIFGTGVSLDAFKRAQSAFWNLVCGDAGDCSTGLQGLPQLQSNGNDFSHFVAMSYAAPRSGDVCDFSPGIYTGQEVRTIGVDRAARNVQCLVSGIIEEYGDVHFDFITHSLGGVVASYYLDQVATFSEKSAVHSVITMDSPVSGVDSDAIGILAAKYLLNKLACFGVPCGDALVDLIQVLILADGGPNGSTGWPCPLVPTPFPYLWKTAADLANCPFDSSTTPVDRIQGAGGRNSQIFTLRNVMDLFIHSPWATFGEMARSARDCQGNYGPHPSDLNHGAILHNDEAKRQVLSVVKNATLDGCRNKASFDVWIFSPADILVTDPQGRRVGTAPGIGTVNEVPGATYTGPSSEPEAITIANPLDGRYLVSVTGTGPGTASLLVSGGGGGDSESTITSFESSAALQASVEANLGQGSPPVISPLLPFQPPQVDFQASPVGLHADVAFLANASVGTYPVIAWAWDFGDGSTSTEQNPQHTFAARGTNRVSLTVTDAAGNAASVSRDVVVAQADHKADTNQDGYSAADENTAANCGVVSCSSIITFGTSETRSCKDPGRQCGSPNPPVDDNGPARTAPPPATGYGCLVTLDVMPPLMTKRLAQSDVDLDGAVTILDLSKVASWYGNAINASSADPRWEGDMDGDGHITILDLSAVASNYGRSVANNCKVE
jgi:PKD repeat protein